MYRPSFGVVSGVVTVLVCIALVAKAMESFIPQPPANSLGNQKAAYLQAGSRQRINWRPLEPEAFSDARRRDMPILLVVGAPWCKYGRDMDSGVFSDTAIQNYLARNFLCVRVDSLQMPEWRNAFLPFSCARPDGLILPGFTAWVLDSTGAMFDFYARSAGNQGADSRTFLGFLVQARGRFDNLTPESLIDTPGGTLQKTDRDAIEQSHISLPDFSRHLQNLRSATNDDYGGIPVGGVQAIRPSCWRFMLLAGDVGAFQRSADPLLMSPLVDLIDGGFFVGSETVDGRTLNYDKVAVTNADMLRTLCLAGAVTGDPLYRKLAEGTFDSLLGEFHRNDAIEGCRIGDEIPMNRSRRSSFSPRQLRSIFPDPDDRDWARKFLGLQTESNPQMTPYLTSRDLLLDRKPMFDKIVGSLRVAASAKEPRFAGDQQLDVTGFAVARLIDTARTWRDPQRMAAAEAVFNNLDVYRAANDVVHSLAEDRRGDASLVDYLAYADAALSHYLATGKLVDLDNGKEVLRRGLYLFRGSRLGEFKMSNSDLGIPPNGDEVPEIVDGVEESATAQLIRLCQSYARLYVGSDPRGVAELSGAANSATNLCAPMAGEIGSLASGFFCATSRVRDSAFVVTAGPDAVAAANALAPRLVARVVAPAVGRVRPDLQKLGPGVYIVRDGSTEGPLTADAAVAKLGSCLQLDLRRP